MKKHDSEDPEKKTCDCASCQAKADGASHEEMIEKYKEWQQKCLIEYGFYIDVVGDDPSSPTGFNAHTHGLDQYNDHLDFQVVLQLPVQVVHSVLSSMATSVKNGEVFENGQSFVKHKFPYKIVEVEESDRKVLRIIFPDFKGNIEPDKMIDSFALQYKGVPGVELKPKQKPKWQAYKPHKS